MSNLQGRDPGVPDPLPVYRRDSDNSRPEQVGTLRIREVAGYLFLIEVHLGKSHTYSITPVLLY